MEPTTGRFKEFAELINIMQVDDEQVNLQLLQDEDRLLLDAPHAEHLLRLKESRWSEFFRIFVQDLAFGYTHDDWIKCLLIEGNIGLAQQVAYASENINTYRGEIKKQEKEWMVLCQSIKSEADNYFHRHKEEIEADEIEESREFREIGEKYEQYRSFGDAASAYEQMHKILKEGIEKRKIVLEITIEKILKQITQTLVQLLTTKPENFPGGQQSHGQTMSILSKAQELILQGDFVYAQQVAEWAQLICDGKENEIPLDKIQKLLTIQNKRVVEKIERKVPAVVMVEPTEYFFEHEWTKEEDEYLINNYDVMSNHQLNQRFLTSIKDIEDRIKYHGLILDRETRKRVQWKNPYVAGKPIRDKRVFVGREDIFNFIKANMQADSEGDDILDHNLITIFGHRRTGKTSILLQLKRNRREVLGSRIPIFIDVEGMLPFPSTTSSTGHPISSLANFFYKLAYIIKDELREEGIEIQVPDPTFFSDPSWNFQGFLKDVEKQIGSSGLVLMMDEFQALEPRFSLLDVDIYKMLRHIIQHDTKVDFILAGTMEMERIMREYRAAMFGSAISKHIDFLDDQDARQLIVEPVHKNISYEKDAENLIINITACHPYFVQLVCWSVTRYLIDRGKSKVTVSDIEKILPQVIEQGFHFDEIWVTDTSDLELYIMSIVGELSSGFMSSCLVSQLEGKLRAEGHYPKNQGDFNEALNNLINRKIMKYTDSGNKICFHVGVFGKWVQSNKPLAIVKRDLQAEAARQRRKVERQPISR